MSGLDINSAPSVIPVHGSGDTVWSRLSGHSLSRWLDFDRTKRLPFALGFVAMILTLPALAVGFAQDDYFFLGIFKGSPGLEALAQPIWNTFTFSEGAEELNRVRMDLGILPWWAVDGWKVDLWRPLASLSHWIDYKLFGEAPFPMHVHSLLLYGALGIAAAIAYRGILGRGWIAGFAGLLFVVDSGHGIPVGWLSNRNALLSALFCVSALIAHHHWRKNATIEKPLGTWHTHGLMANVLLALALLSGEGAVALGGYFFAYALFMDPVSRNEGRRGLLIALALLVPYLLVVVAWREVYVSLGHGTFGSWLYVDPLSEPFVFLRNAVAHYPVLLLGLFGIPDSTVWMALPALWQWIHVIAAAAFVVCASWIAWPLLKASAQARFLGLGALLAVVPMCATLPSDRNLIVPSLGAMGFVALYIGSLFDGKTRRVAQDPTKRSERALAYSWIAVHLLLSPILLLGSAYSISAMDRVFRAANDSIPAGVEVSNTTYVVLNTPVDLLGASLPLFRSGQDAALPRHWRWLCASVGILEVERLDDYTIALRPEGGFLQRPWSQIFRRPETAPLTAGSVVQLDGMEARVTVSGDDGRPREVRFRFDVPLEDESLAWVSWEKGAYVKVDLPVPGSRITLPGVQLRDLLKVAFGVERSQGSRNAGNSHFGERHYALWNAENIAKR